MLQALEDGVYGGVEFKKGDNIIGVGISDLERADLLADGFVKEVDDAEATPPPKKTERKLSVVKEEKKAPPKKATTAKKSTAKKTTARKTTTKKGA